MKIFWKKIKKEKGFTLIELLVSAAIFSILILSATGIFVKIMNVQKKALAIQEVQDNISYTMEMISKEIRMMSEITTEDTGTNGSPYFEFKNSKDKDIIYRLEGDYLTRSVDGGTQYPITSESVDVTELRFYVNNCLDGGAIIAQPTVTVNIVMEISDGNFGKARARLQTTLSGRIYEN